MKPWMTPREVQCLKKFLTKATYYFEFGSGGSTHFALQTSKGKVVSVESAKPWVKRVRKTLRKYGDRLSVRWIDIGPVGNCGIPTNSKTSSRWPNYSLAIKKLPPGTQVDTVLVDGRFRVACILQTILTFPNATVCVHDFWKRPEYHVVLPFFYVIAGADTLVVMKAKPDFHREKAQTLWEKYKLMTR